MIIATSRKGFCNKIPIASVWRRPHRRRVDAVLVVGEADLGQPRPAGVLETAGVGTAGDAVVVIDVIRDRIAGGVGQGDDAAARREASGASSARCFILILR